MSPPSRESAATAPASRVAPRNVPRPPRIFPRRPAWRNNPPLPLVAGLALAAMLAGAALLARLELPLPVCGLKRLAGIPCPFCGGTRSLMATAQFDLFDALALNPVVFLGSVAIACWFAVWLVDRWWQTAWHERLRLLLVHRRAPWVIGGILLANWVYLVCTLP